MMANKANGTKVLTLSRVPTGVVEELDEIATAESRSRSAQTVVLLREILAIKRGLRSILRSNTAKDEKAVAP